MTTDYSPITDAVQITPTWLTAILRREGILPQGEVEVITGCNSDAFNSACLHLDAEYSPDAPAAAPRQLFLKCNVDAEWGREAGKSEVAFYEIVRPLQNDLPMIVPCYDAVYAPDTGDSHVLLANLSSTHAPPVTRDEQIALQNVPSEKQLEAIVDVVARLHAYWWQHPSLGDDTLAVSGWYGSREQFDTSVSDWRAAWTAFIADEGETFPADLRTIYEHALDRFPVLWDRYLAPRVTTHKNLTLVHGDCYLCQFLCPKDGGDQTYLVDFQGAYTDFPTIDLTHLFATFWTREQRHEGDREKRMLRLYLDRLHGYGVTGYSWDDLCADYRLLLIFMIFYPIWDQTNGSGKGYWWPKLQCLTSAYSDWKCQELLA